MWDGLLGEAAMTATLDSGLWATSVMAGPRGSDASGLRARGLGVGGSAHRVLNREAGNRDGE